MSISTKKKNNRDTEIDSAVKGNQWFGGMCCHVGVNFADALFAQRWALTCNHELNTAADSLHGNEANIYDESGYLVIEKCEWSSRDAMPI